MSPFQNVTALVDWNSQLLACGVSSEQKPLEAARLTFPRTTRRIARCLLKADPTRIFGVSLRLYHGWHKGFEPTANLRAAKIVIAETDFATLSDKSQVVFNPEVSYGDKLIAALATRIHSRLAIHLPNTYRKRNDVWHEEKTVDTALATDAVVLAHRDPTNWIIAAAEDDDVVPPLFAVETYLHPGARVLLLRARDHGRNFLKLDGLVSIL